MYLCDMRHATCDMRHAFIVLIALMSARANAGEYKATAEQDFQNVRLSVSVAVSEAYGPAHLISGTKCDIAPTVKAFQLGIPGFVIAVWNVHAKLDVGLNVGGRNLYDVPIENGVGGGGERPVRKRDGGEVLPESLMASVSPEVKAAEDLPEIVNIKPAYQARFASTKFPDTTDVPITLTITFWCWVSTPFGPAPVERVVLATVTPKVYNTQLRWMSELEGDGTPITDEYKLADLVALTAGLSGHASFANHSQVSATVLLTKQQILEKIPEATAIGANTHGLETGLQSGGTENFLHGFIGWAEFAAKPPREGLPLRNWAFMYACLAAKRGPPLMPDFHVVPTGFVAGFTSIIIHQPPGRALAPHFATVRQQLEAGARAKWAITRANTENIFFSPPGEGMSLIGDDNASSKWVYLEESLRAAISVDDPSTYEDDEAQTVNGLCPFWYYVWGLGTYG